MNEIRGGYTHFGLKLEFGFFKIHPRNEWGGHKTEAEIIWETRIIQITRVPIDGKFCSKVKALNLKKFQQVSEIEFWRIFENKACLSVKTFGTT